MKILVTGGAGFIGSHIADELLARGDEVVCMDNFNDYYDPAYKRRNVAPSLGHPAYTLHDADIRDAEVTEHVFATERPDKVIHLAAMAGVRYSIERAPLYVAVNVQGTINVLEAARRHRARNFVFASTSSVYGRSNSVPFREDDSTDHPLAPYPATKKADEVMGHAYHNLFGLNFTALRFFSVYGPRGRPDMMPYMVTDRILHDGEIVLFEAGQMHRDWTYIADIVSGVIAALDTDLPYEIINLGRGEPVLMADFVRLVEELVGKRARLVTPPAPPSEPPITYADISKARRLLGYNPQTGVAEGMRRFVDWYQGEVLATAT
ncbi:MAG: GDP-mannose 4,6-dehydratase [Chloroflexota bacterium]|nr:GDP-mannose 4,6-dehydratase [Chloroflexota bacterium]